MREETAGSNGEDQVQILDVLSTKKPDESPYVTHVGPAKNLPKKRQRYAQQDLKTQWSLLVYFVFLGKNV
jgi:hypothetical protein